MVCSLASLSLELGIAIYLLVLMTISYIMIRLYVFNFKPFLVLWQPFKLLSARFYQQWSVRTSFINVFAAFFFLTSIKSLLVCIQILNPIHVVHHSPMEPVKTSWRHIKQRHGCHNCSKQVERISVENITEIHGYIYSSGTHVKT